MRARPPARPCAISSALATEWLGTNPSARAATESRLPATMTRPRRASAGWQPAQSAKGSSGWQARPARYAERARGVRGRSLLGVRHRVAAPCAEVLEERAVRILRSVRERPRERADEDQRPVRVDGKGISPLPEREPECDTGRRDRVQRLPRRVDTDPRHTHDHRIERLGEPDSTQLDGSDERLGVRDRRRSCEDGRRGERARLIAQDATPHGAGKCRVEAAERRAYDMVEGLRRVRVVAKASREPRMVEYQGHAVERYPRCDGALDGERELPGMFAGGLDERRRLSRTPNSRCVTRREERPRSAVNDGLGR